MADTSKATKYDLIQKERVCDDIWLCTTRPEEKCYKPCKVHNPNACDGAGLPGVDWDDDDVFEDDEEDVIEDEPIDTSFSDTEVWDSDVDAIDDIPTPEAQIVNREMERWMQVADLFYSQDSQPAVTPSYGIIPVHPNHAQPLAYFPWSTIYPSGHPAYPMPLPHGSVPYPPMPIHHVYSSTTQDFINANNMMNNDPWPLISRTSATRNQQQASSRGWDELMEEQEKLQEEMAAAMAAQCVGATEECETTSDTIPTAAPRFSHPHTVYSTDFWRRNTHQHQQMDSL